MIMKWLKRATWDEDFTENGYTQMVIWPATTLDEGDEEEFHEFATSNFGLEHPIILVGCVETLPTPDEEGTGGRIDTAFYIHDEDIMGFALKRFSWGMRWWEDVLGNERRDMVESGHEGQSIYPQDFRDEYPEAWRYEG